MTTDPADGSPASSAGACERLAEYLYGPVAQAIRSWGVERRDIYGIWLILHLAEDDPRRPQLGSVGYLSEKYITEERAQSYGSRWAPPCVMRESILHLCQESGEWYGDLEEPGDPQGRALRDACFAERGLAPTGNGNGYVEAFLDACGAVIRRLHAESVLTYITGRSIPVGMNFSNDIGHEFGLSQTRDANPPDLSQGMEEWMIGETYDVRAAREALLAEIAALPPQEQADFWVDALVVLQENLWGKIETPLSTRLRAVNIGTQISVESLLCSPIGPLAVPRLVGVAETRAGVRPVSFQSRAGVDDWVTSAVILVLRSIAADEERRAEVHEEEGERLHRLLARLFHESETAPKINTNLHNLAETLHVLRPERFPRPQWGTGGARANRLLQWREFGLERANPLTPDYDPDRKRLEEAYAAFQRDLEENPRL